MIIVFDNANVSQIGSAKDFGMGLKSILRKSKPLNKQLEKLLRNVCEFFLFFFFRLVVS